MSTRLSEKVLLIGWDAADWRMIQPLVEAGQMPTLASLMQRGVHGRLATIQPILSPMLWTSIATGKRADKHGICGFIEPRPDGQGVRPVASTSRTCKALWNIATQSGLRSNVAGWFASHPTEPIRGRFVSDRYTTCARPGLVGQLPEGAVHPPDLAGPLRDLLVDPQSLDSQALLPFIPEAANIDQKQDDRLAKLAMLLARTASMQAAAMHLLSQEVCDLNCFFFEGIDQFGHAFMPYHPPAVEGVSPEDAALYGQVMNGCYRFHDMMLDALLKAAGEDTTVILVSDHGFHSDAARPGADGFADPEGWHRPFGVALLAGPGVVRDQQLYGATLLDVTPTVLTLLGLPLGADMDGRPWLEVLDRPVQADRVFSWDTLEGEAGQHPAEAREDPLSSAEAMAHLVELGYVEPPGEDEQADIERARRNLRYNRARALSDSRRMDAAIAQWRELAELYPDETGYVVELARCLGRVGEEAAAREQIDSLDEHSRHAPDVRLLRATLAERAGAPEQALAELSELAEQYPDVPLVHLRLGQWHLRRGELAEAERALGRAAELEAESPEIADAWAELALKQGQAEEAVRRALEAVSLAHYFPKAHYHLGCALAAAGDPTRAMQALRTSLNQAPQLKAAQRQLEALQSRHGADGAPGLS